MQGKITAITINKKDGEAKEKVDFAALVKGMGLKGNENGKNWQGAAQVNLVSGEILEKMKKKGIEVNAGGLSENIITYGIDFKSLKVDDKLKLGDSVKLKISSIDKSVFCRVLNSGWISVGDDIGVYTRQDIQKLAEK